MSDITNYFEHAELALAAYSNLWNGMSQAAYEAALRQNGQGMSPTQAARFAERWRVVDQYTSSGVTGTGFSATVFEEISGPNAGKRYLAIRGTEPSSLLDLIADADLALVNGVAARQAVDLNGFGGDDAIVGGAGVDGISSGAANDASFDATAIEILLRKAA